MLQRIMHGLLGKRDDVMCPGAFQQQKFLMLEMAAGRLGKEETGQLRDPRAYRIGSGQID